MAVENKEPICIFCPALRIKIKVFNLFKYDLVVYMRRIANTDSIAIRNCRLQVLAYLVGLAFKDNKRWDNMAVYINCFYNYNRFITKRLTYFIPYCLIINNKYLFFFALSYIYT